MHPFQFQQHTFMIPPGPSSAPPVMAPSSWGSPLPRSHRHSRPFLPLASLLLLFLFAKRTLLAPPWLPAPFHRHTLTAVQNDRPAGVSRHLLRIADGKNDDGDLYGRVAAKEPGQRLHRLLAGNEISVHHIRTNNTIEALATEEGLMGTVLCQGVRQHLGYGDSCAFVKANKQCRSGSAIDYTQFFFCKCAKVPAIGYLVLTLWLVALFYMLGNTAADYFCCSLEKLSKLLKCPATLAGVTLLPLGNGAPDVFASIAAFVGAGAGQVGLNSVLGGAIFITSVVAGSVCLLVAGSPPARIDRRCFIRDVCFFLFTLLALFVILLAGKIYLWGALAFLSIYALYAVAVAVSEVLRRPPHKPSWLPMVPLPFTDVPAGRGEDDDSIYSPLLDSESLPSGQAVETTLPQWMWASNVAIYSQQPGGRKGEISRPLWGWGEEQDLEESQGKWSARCMCRYLLEWPVTLPRRLTIPIVEEDRWSRSLAVASAGLAPVLLTLILNSQDGQLFGGSIAVYMGGVLLGVTVAVAAFFTTKSERPPRRFLFPWVAGGFLMSIVWFYVIANELVALLVTFGILLEIDPSILGVTVLAWGNSMGDLMANIALAISGGDGLQIAMSGCYAGPMFNTLIGLGVSLVLGSWGTSPAPFPVPRDDSLYYTLGFLVVGLVWALTVLPSNGMRPSKLMGIGLLTLYALFLALKLSHALGLISITGLS